MFDVHPVYKAKTTRQLQLLRNRLIAQSDEGPPGKKRIRSMVILEIMSELENRLAIPRS